MQPLICFTHFLRSGKKLKLESGETYDDLRRNNNDFSEKLKESMNEDLNQANEMVGGKVGVIPGEK